MRPGLSITQKLVNGKKVFSIEVSNCEPELFKQLMKVLGQADYFMQEWKYEAKE